MFKKLGVAGLVAALSFSGLSGCASKTGKGALIGTGAGAAVGAGIGALVGGKEGAIIGAGAGAAMGAASGAIIGNYMDKQEKELKEQVKNAVIERTADDQLVVRFNSGLLFDTGKSELKPASKTDLAEFAGILKKYPDTKIAVEGHTDSTGPKELNVRLSKSRAESVTGNLFLNGVEQARMMAAGFADERPIADNATAEGRQLNRRVEVKITPNEKLLKEASSTAQ